MSDSDKIQYSVVIPLFNEEECVEPLYQKLKETMESICDPYEVIFVNDGSTDRTREVILEIRENNTDHIKLVNFDKNRGQAQALKAGFDNSRGEVVISLDGDLQNDPRDIPLLIKKLEQGYDAVCGWRHQRMDPISKKIISYLVNIFQRNFLRSGLHDMSCTLRAYKRNCLIELKLERDGYHRFIPYLLILQGKRVGEVKVRHYPRVRGRTKYGFKRVFQVPLAFLRVYFRKGE